MNLSVLKTLGGPRVQKVALKVSKYAPEILTAVGMVGLGASTVMIARATTKLEGVVDTFEESKAAVLANQEQQEIDESVARKQMVKVYAHTSLDLMKLYGPSVSLWVASAGSMLAAHGIMRRRAVALFGAYKAVESAFSAYRSRVIEEFGEDKDREFRLGLRTETIEDPDTGKKKKVVRVDPNGHSQYARFFDEGNDNYRDQPGYNFLFLKNMQNWANDRLHKRGFLFLNEVYKDLGIDMTPEGQIVGWVTGIDGVDNYVDFGIFDGDDFKKRQFVNGEEQSILLDFNVDGTIIDKI